MIQKVTSVPVAVSPDSGLYVYRHSTQLDIRGEHPFTPTQQVAGAFIALGISVALAIALSVLWVKIVNRR